MSVKGCHRSYTLYVVYQRYAEEHLPKPSYRKWTNYGPHHSPLPSTPIITYNEKILSILRQSTLNLSKCIRPKKIRKTVLKIQVYTCTVLSCKACSEWVDEEFQTLVAIVHTLSDTNIDVLSL